MSANDPSRARTEPSASFDITEEWLTPGRFAMVLGLLVMVAFPDVILGKQTFVFRDYGLFSYPVAFFHRQSIWQGTLPLWNPLSQCGLPFLAQWNTLVLYPPSLFYVLLPLTWGLPVFCLAHLAWGGLGMYLLIHYWTRHRLAAGLAGVIFAFNGLSVNFLMWPSHIATFSWVPWVWWLGREGWRHGGRKLVWGTVAAALQMLAGGPETIVSTWLFLAVLAGADVVRSELPRARVAARFGAMAGLVAMLSAPQLLPFFQLLANSQRHAGYASAGWSMPPWGLANFLVPLFRTTPTPQGVFVQQEQGWTSSYYAGIGTVLLALVAMRRVRGWRARGLGLLIFFFLLVVLGDNGGVYPILRAGIPALGFMRFPIKFIILVLALAPVLAAFGLKALIGNGEVAQASSRGPGAKKGGRQGTPAPKTGRCALPRPLGVFEWGCVAALLAGIGAAVMVDWDWSNEIWVIALKNGIARAAFLVLIVLLLALLAKAAGRARFLSGCLLMLVFWLDFRTHVPSQNPTASPEIYTPGFAAEHMPWSSRPTLGHSRAMLGLVGTAALQYHALPNIEQTYLGHRMGLLADCNLIDGVPQVHGFFSLTPAAINEVCEMLYKQADREFRPLLDFMGVSQISSSEKTLEWVERPTAMPLVTIGQRAVFADDGSICGAFTNSAVDLRRVAYLPMEASRSVTVAEEPDARVRALEWTSRQISFQTDAPRPSLAVISQTYYPAWSAYVDGKRARIWKANYAFQALEVPAGAHSVRLVYEDRLLRVGIFLAAAGLAALFGLWLFARPAASMSARPNNVLSSSRSMSSRPLR